jgi:hypothetical protein
MLKLIFKMQEQINKQSIMITKLNKTQNLNNISTHNMVHPQYIYTKNGIFNMEPQTKDMLLIFLIGILLIFLLMSILKK